MFLFLSLALLLDILRSSLCVLSFLLHIIFLCLLFQGDFVDLIFNLSITFPIFFSLSLLFLKIQFLFIRILMRNNLNNFLVLT